MKLSIKKQVTQQQEIEISLPAYFERDGLYRSINEDGDLIVLGKEYISVTRKEDSYYDKDIAEVITMPTCGKAEFEQRRDMTLRTIGRVLGIETVTA